MYAIIISLVICGLILFILFLRKVHTAENNRDHTVSKIYVDAKMVEFDNDILRIDTKPETKIPPGHFEELLEVLNRCSPYKEIFGNYKEYVAINNIIKFPIISSIIRKENFTHVEATNYRDDLGFGGCYFESNEDVAMVHAIGNSEAVLNLCSQRHDREEILRITRKWQKQNYLVVAIATADVYGDKKNVLTRGVKEKMTFLGLLAIPNS